MTFILILTLFFSGTTQYKLELEGEFTIENQLVDSQYPYVGNLHLEQGKYLFRADYKYALDNFKDEFFYQNEKGTYTVDYNRTNFTDLADHEILGTVYFESESREKHALLLRFDRERAELYFHALESKFELFRISKPVEL